MPTVPSKDSVYAVDPRVDVPVALLPGMLSVGWLLVDEPASCAPRCDPSGLNALDRSSAGNFDERWRLASDLGLFGALGSATGVLLADGWFLGGAQDFLVVAESALWANGLAVVGNLALRRPRPLLYGDRAPLTSRENPAAQLSFISGHSALVAALTTSVFSTTYRREPERALPWIVLGVGTAATAFTGLGRVLAGRHFPSDVLLGAGIGASMGLLVPALHDTPIRVSPVATATGVRVTTSGHW